MRGWCSAVILGSFLIHAAATAAPLRGIAQDHECFQRQQLFCGSNITDTLNIYGCGYTNGEYFNAHRVNVNSGQQVTVLMHSTNFKPFLQVMGSDFNYFIVWDENPSSTESRVTFTAFYSGAHYILAGGERPYASTPIIGQYALAVTCSGAGSPAPAGCQEIEIARHPQGSVIPAGSTATLSVVHGGTGPFNYRWYFGESGDESRPVGNSGTYTTQPLFATATYWVRVLNACSIAASEHATVFTTCEPPIIAIQPQSRSVAYGSSVTVTVTVTGSPPMTYDWYEQPTRLISSSSSPTLTISQMTATKSFMVIARNSCGSAPSQPFTIAVEDPRRRRSVRR